MLSAAFSKVQFVRLSTMVKPFWFVLAAYFAVAAFDARHAIGRARPTRRRRRGHGSRESLATSAVLAASVALLDAAGAGADGAGVLGAPRAQDDGHRVDAAAARATAAALEQWLTHNLPKDGFYRVGVFMGHNHELLDLGTLIDRPIYKRGFTPASNFIYQMQDRDPAILDAVNLRFAISKQFLPAEDFEPVASFGHYTRVSLPALATQAVRDHRGRRARSSSSASATRRSRCARRPARTASCA